MKKLMALMILPLVMTGCASSGQLEKKVAFDMGYEQEDVRVSNVDHGLYQTTFNSKIAGKKYNCSALGGNIMTFGIALYPKCTQLKTSR